MFKNSFQITGLTPIEARDLALLLRAGALAAPVYKIDERTIGPSLGQDNIDRGFKAIKIGFLAVIVFMAIYYKAFGLIANHRTVFEPYFHRRNAVVPASLLTCPGIAGIVLTVGMAVDANVLIFERIREEISSGASPQNAINSGYEKALSSITDANITTLIAAIVLFGVGTGANQGIRDHVDARHHHLDVHSDCGHALDRQYRVRRAQAYVDTGLGIRKMRIIKKTTSFDFLSVRRRRIALAISALFVIASLVSLATRGLEFGIDFTGGILLEVGYPQAANLDEIRSNLRAAGFSDAQVQRFGRDTDVLVRLPPQPGTEADEVRAELRQILQSSGESVELRRVEFVSAQVGSELAERGALALVIALLMIFHVRHDSLSVEILRRCGGRTCA